MLHCKDLVWKTDVELAAIDVAVRNLACASDFPDAPTAQEIAECFRRLDYAAASIKSYTEQQLPKFRADPGHYDHSEAKFRVITMISVLQRVFGVLYNPGKIPDDAPFKTEDTFIHGVLLGRGGTCASLPVVYAAVGRRLGYPIKLVTTKRHLFCRWDQPGGVRFNIEANNSSIDTPDDQKYREGIYAFPPGSEKAFRFLESLTPRMELSAFMVQRGIRWAELKRHRESVEAFTWACALDPDNQAPQICHQQALREWCQHLTAQMTPNFPEMTVGFPMVRRYPFAVIPEKVERLMILCEHLEKFLNEEDSQVWLRALRATPNRRPASVPSQIHVQLSH